MYFLFNEIDDSYNCSSDTNFPDYMIPEGLYEVEISQEQVDAIAEDSITFTSYNRETGVLYLDDHIYPETAAGKIKLEESMRSILLIPEDERPPQAVEVLNSGVRVFDNAKLDDIFNSVALTDEDSEAILDYLDTAE